MMPNAQRFIAQPKSPLEGVPVAAWGRFIAALEVQPVNARSPSGGLGAYDIRPRRLVELGYASELTSKRTSTGRQVQVCEFVLPWTQSKFLADPVAQFAAVSKSILLYHRAIVSGELKKPKGCSVAGALAILQVGGRGALESWPNLFTDTQAVYDACKGAF